MIRVSGEYQEIPYDIFITENTNYRIYSYNNIIYLEIGLNESNFVYILYEGTHNQCKITYNKLRQDIAKGKKDVYVGGIQ